MLQHRCHTLACTLPPLVYVFVCSLSMRHPSSPALPQLRADLEQLKQARETEQDRLQRWATQLDARHLQIAREADEAAAVR
jgi:hypothetical protein